MKIRIVNWVWGIILILGGGFLLAQNMGYIQEFSLQFWVVTFAGLSFLFLISYFLSGISSWGWLFPALVCGAVALTIGLAESGFDDAIIGAPILLSVGIPFLVAYGLKPKENTWALIPAWVLVALASITAMADRVQGEMIGSFFLIAVALPFIVVYLRNRSQVWALYLGFGLAALAVVPLLATVASGELIGAFVMVAIAVPFFYVYFRSEPNWWALIPAGVLASIGLMLLLMATLPYRWRFDEILPGVMFLGWTATFGVLWLRRAVLPTGWAIWPAVGTLIVAVIIFTASSEMDYIWPIVFIGAGGLLLFTNLRKK